MLWASIGGLPFARPAPFDLPDASPAPVVTSNI
jgi:hypothetical protein